MYSLKSQIKTLTEKFAQEKTNLLAEKENMLVDHQGEIDTLKRHIKNMADEMQSQRKPSNLVIRYLNMCSPLVSIHSHILNCRRLLKSLRRLKALLLNPAGRF